MVSILRFLAIALFLIGTRAAVAADLQVAPTMLDIAAPQAAATITLRKAGPDVANVQIRVFKWVQEGGAERLEPTNDVVASPPATKIVAGKDYVVRIVRVSKAPVAAEESYRLLVDQLPVSAKSGATTVKLLVRYSIPVFFNEPETTAASLKWSVAWSGPNLVVTVKNNGDKRERISSLRLTDQNNHVISFGDGLVGYVLGHTTMSWKVAGKEKKFARKGTIRLAAEGYGGRLDERVSLASRN